MVNPKNCQVVCWAFTTNIEVLMMKRVALIVGCCFVLILRKGNWTELIGHPKDRGKNRRNSRTNSLQPGEDDADRRSNSRRPSER
jgi:hypothetical protein